MSLNGRACATAIAAALALTATPAIAQDATADPVVTDTASDPLAPTSEPVVKPVVEPVSDSSETVATTAAETPAAEPKAEAAPAKAKRATASRTARVAAPAARPVAMPADPVADAPAADPQLMPPPVAEVPVAEAQPLPAGPVLAEKKPIAIDEEAAMIGGSALALLALGGAAVAMRRRRREDEDEEMWIDEEPAPEPRMAPVEPLAREPKLVTAPRPAAPVAEPKPLVAPSMAALGGGFMLRRAGSEEPGTTRATVKPATPAPGSETWTERAMRGPTPDNPSLSLKKRLKRAAFFDKRERDAAAGQAPAVEATAGLPERAVREFEPAFA